MLKDKTAEALRGRADNLRTAAQDAEDTCVKIRLLANARDFERLIDIVTPVLSADESRAAH